MITDAEGLAAEDAVTPIRVGDLELIEGEWPILGELSGWRREDYPMPEFVNIEELSGRKWIVRYADDDVSQVSERRLVRRVPRGMQRNVTYGADATTYYVSEQLKRRRRAPRRG